MSVPDLSPTDLRESIFSRVKKSPQFIPLLVYLHPPPTRPLVPSQTDYWTQSLIDFYPKGLKNQVLTALATNPERIVPLIPYILTRISAPNIISEPQVEVVAASVNRGPSGIILPQIPPPNSLTASIPSPVSSPVEGERFYLTPRRMARGGEFSRGDRSHYSVGRMRSRQGPIPNEVGTGRVLHFPPASPDLSSVRSGKEPGIVGRDVPLNTDLDPLSPQPAPVDPYPVHDGITFWVNQDTYHLSIPRCYIIYVYSVVYGFLVGFFSTWVFFVLSFSPVAALIGGIPLSWAVFLIVGPRYLPAEYQNVVGWPGF